MPVDCRVAIQDILCCEDWRLSLPNTARVRGGRVVESQRAACEDTCDALIAGTRLACLTCESRGASGQEGARLAHS